jgi:hypothetical protein
LNPVSLTVTGLGDSVPTSIGPSDMVASNTCSKCGSTALRHSRWQWRDGLLRSLFYSAVRCQTCQQRQFRFSPWVAVLTIAVVLLVAFVVGVIYAVSR